MKLDYTYIAKIAATGIFSFIKINLVGLISTALTAGFGIFLLMKDLDSSNYMSGGGHFAWLGALMTLFSIRPIGFVLWIFSFFGGTTLYYSLGMKYILAKLTNKIVAEKWNSHIVPTLEEFAIQFKEKQPDGLKDLGDFAMKKVHFISTIRADQSQNKWMRRVLVFGLKKVELGDVDFTQENISFVDIFKEKAIQSLRSIAAPSRLWFWIIMGLQWLFFLVIRLTKL
jgi:hypothetical protein